MKTPLARYKIIDKVFDLPMQNPNFPGFMMGGYQTLIVSGTAQHGLIYKPGIEELKKLDAPLVRINSACYTGDIFGDRRCDCTEQMFAAMDMISTDSGLVLYHFNHEGRGLGFTSKLQAYKQMAEEGVSTFEAMSEQVGVSDLRRFGSAVTILKDLGLNKIRLITNNPEKSGVLEENGIEVVETIPIVIDRPEIRRYLITKQHGQGHTFNFDSEAPSEKQDIEVKKEGLIVLGAQGSLGKAFVEAAKRNGKFEETHVHLLDKFFDASNSIIGCNLSRESNIKTALDGIDFSKSEHWRIVVATGIYNGKDSKSMDWERISETLQVNLIGVSQFVIGAVDRIKKAEKTARIAVVSSAAAGVGSRDLGYGISKAGLIGLVRSVSKQSAEDGITTIGIAPGLFTSSMSNDFQTEDRKQDAIKQGHLGKSLDLQEVAKSVFLAVYEAPDAMTGTFMNPNGGQVASVEYGF